MKLTAPDLVTAAAVFLWMAAIAAPWLVPFAMVASITGATWTYRRSMQRRAKVRAEEEAERSRRFQERLTLTTCTLCAKVRDA